MNTKKRVAIVGGGVSGLTAAFRLLQQAKLQDLDLSVTVFDKTELGGVFKTIEKDNCSFEGGPDSFFTKTKDVLELCEDLGITSEIIATNDKKRKSMVAKENELIPLPDGFVMIAPSNPDAFMQSPLMSENGKLRALKETSIPAADASREESVATFVERRFGKELLDKIVQPMVGGIYTGDVNKLSASACLPEFVEMERTQGSIIKALGAREKNTDTKGARYAAFFSFKKGMGFLIDTLSQKIEELNGGVFHSRNNIESIEQDACGQWQLQLCNDSIKSFDAVILALPPRSLCTVLKQTHQELAAKCAEIQGASSIVVNLLFNLSDIDQAKLDGFGFVVPQESGRALLACSYLSVKYNERCAPEKVILRAFFGGVANEQISRESDEKITELVLAELLYFLNIKSKPLSLTISRWQEAMPQYTIGHQDRIDAITKCLEELPGVFVTGNFISGVGIPKCVELASGAAINAANYLRHPR